MKLSIVFTSVALSLALAACGGKSKPADTAGGGAEETKVAGDCCCEFIEETMIGDGSEDTAENQVTRMMTGQECEENSGSCIDAATCAATEATDGHDMPPPAEEEETIGD